MNIKLESQTSSNVTVNTYGLITDRGPVTYIEYLNEKGKVIDMNLRDENGEEIDDPVFLEEILDFIDSNPQTIQSQEDAAETQRRDEKHGLYGGEEDVAN